MEIIKAALKLYFMRKQRNNMRVFLKISVFKNFSKFTRKISVPECLVLRPTTSLKKRLRHRCFSVSFCEILGTANFIELLPWPLSIILTWIKQLLTLYRNLKFKWKWIALIQNFCAIFNMTTWRKLASH